MAWDVVARSQYVSALGEGCGASDGAADAAGETGEAGEADPHAASRPTTMLARRMSRRRGRRMEDPRGDGDAVVTPPDGVGFRDSSAPPDPTVRRLSHDSGLDS